MRESDMRRVLRAASDLADVEDAEMIPTAALREISGLIPGEACNYTMISLDTLAVRDVVAVPDDITPDVGALIQPHLHEHPAIPVALASEKVQAVRISDGSTLRAWKQTNLYQETFRPFGFVHQIGGLAAREGGHFRSYAVIRGQEDFADRERDILTLMTRELSRIHRRADTREQLHALAAGAREAVRTDERGVAVVDARGTLRPLNAKAAEVLADPRVRGDAGLCRELAVDKEVRPVVRVLHLRGAAGPLRIQIVPALEPLLRCLLIIHDDGRSAAAAHEYRITARECQVLGLVAEGRTAAAIARRLQLSPRTVEKHLERLYTKLGVSDRVGAVLRGQELGILAMSAPPPQAAR
jgi:DNA-binding CsgD family transcriptional regulator